MLSPKPQETTKPDTPRRGSVQQALGGGWRGLEQKQQEAAQEAAGGGLNRGWGSGVQTGGQIVPRSGLNQATELGQRGDST